MAKQTKPTTPTITINSPLNTSQIEGFDLPTSGHYSRLLIDDLVVEVKLYEYGNTSVFRTSGKFISPENWVYTFRDVPLGTYQIRAFLFDSEHTQLATSALIQVDVIEPSYKLQASK